MAANTVTSSTGTAAGTDPNFTVTYFTNATEGVVLFLKYTKGTESHLTLTFETINRSLSTTDEYYLTSLSGTTLSVYTMVITASGNYRIPIPIICTEKTIIANIVYGSTGSGGATVANFMEV